MPIRLDTVLKEVEHMSNRVNSYLLKDFYQHMKDNGTFQNYQKGNLKGNGSFCRAYLARQHPSMMWIINRLSAS
jgi:hypothetical protein